MRSGTTATRENFRAKLVERDGQECVWSGLGQGVGMHIIPFSEGDDWLQLTIRNRPQYGEQGLETLKSANDRKVVPLSIVTLTLVSLPY